MQQYKLYFKIIAGVFILAIIAFLCLLFLSPFSLSFYRLFLIIASISLTFILSAKFFIFKKPTIAWFALFLVGFCVIIILYYGQMIDDKFWPVFFSWSSVCCAVVGVFAKSALSLNLSIILLVLSSIFFLWSFRLVGLGEVLILIFLFFILKLILNIVIYTIKRRYYGKI